MVYLKMRKVRKRKISSVSANVCCREFNEYMKFPA